MLRASKSPNFFGASYITYFSTFSTSKTFAQLLFLAILIGVTAVRVIAMAKDPRIKDLLAIPREESVHAVIAVGHPAVAYQRLAGRRKAVSRFVEP